jgi:peptidoglycan-N-acetylglucosamine deacetylase
MRRRVAIGGAVVLAISLAAVAAARHGGHGSELDSLVKLGEPIYCGGGAGPYVALTFDDGPTAFTPELVRVLRANGARGTFFEIGRQAAKHPELTRVEASAGAVGTHTWSHADLSQLSGVGVERELRMGVAAIESASRTRVRLFRPPFGAGGATVDGAARHLGLVTVLWNVDSGDASGPSTPPSRVTDRRLLERVRPGSIVLLHEDVTVPRNVGAMRLFLPALRRRGLKAVTVPDLFRLDPPVRSEIPNGSGGCNVTWHR